MENILLTIVLAPLAGSIVAGFWGGKIGRAGAHWVASTGVGISALLSLYVLSTQLAEGAKALDITVYNWMVAEGVRFEVGFLVDSFNQMIRDVRDTSPRSTNFATSGTTVRATISETAMTIDTVVPILSM